MVSKADPLSSIAPSPNENEMLLIVHAFMVSVCRRHIYIDDCRQFETIFFRVYAIFKRARAKASQAEFGQFMMTFGKSFAEHAEVRHFLTSHKTISNMICVNHHPNLKLFFHACTKRHIDSSNMTHKVWFPIFAIRAGNCIQLASISQKSICISQLMTTTLTDNTRAAFDVVIVLSSQDAKVNTPWTRISNYVRWMFGSQIYNTISIGFSLGGWLYYLEHGFPSLLAPLRPTDRS